MSTAQDGRLKDLPRIARAGVEQAWKRRDECVARLEAAQRAIEDALAKGKLKPGRMTIQALLDAAKLNPAYLEKKHKKDLKESIKRWISDVNDDLLSEGLPSTSRPSRGSPSSIDFKRMQGKYVALKYERDHLGFEVVRLKELVRILEEANERYREALNGVEVSTCRVY